METFEVNIVMYKRPDMAKKLISHVRREYDAKIRVWDNSPTPSDFDVEYRWNRFNPSLTRVWNWAIAQSQTDWVMVSNDDIELADGWYGRLCREIENNPESLWHGPSRCFLFHKKLIESVGWFDERMTGITWEDLDYVRRLNHSGVQHNYGVLSCLELDAASTKSHTLSDRFNPPANNGEFFKEKYGDNNGEDFYGTPKLSTPDFYPNRNIHVRA